ncbi:MAG: hypothetical protein ACI9R3_001712 [Verrucomicrobiales bacterium]|jgi:hypothetical protein
MMKMNNLLCKLPAWTAAVALCGALLPIQNVAAQNEAEASTDGLVDLTPKRYKVDRYKSIWTERSPFEIIVDEEPEVIDEDPPFEDYSLAGYSKRGNVWRVTVVSVKDPKEKHYLETGSVSKEGFELLNFEPDRNYKKSEIVVRRGGKSGKIGFNDKQLKPSSFAKGSPARGTPPKKATTKTGQTNQTAKGKPGQPAANNKATAKKTDAAAQIRAMLQNRSSGKTDSNATTQSTSKRQPRRRVILPPSR